MTQVQTQDAARQWIKTYSESEWRSTRVEALRELGSFQDSRSFQFLVEILSQKEDITLQELALFALANRKNRSSRLFLKKFYARASETLRSKAAFALGIAHVFEMGPKLLKDLDQAIQKQDLVWVKNIILSLGELKEFSALPKLRKLLEDRMNDEATTMELKLALLFSLGRLERDLTRLSGFESSFFEDSILYQVYQNTRTMVQIRSQFKLEDYLSRIFDGKTQHPSLPLELRAFDPAEVAVGFSLFDMAKDWKQFLFAANGLSIEARNKLVEEIFQSAFAGSGDYAPFFEALSGMDLSGAEGLAKKIESGIPELKTDLPLRLLFLQAFAEVWDLNQEAPAFLTQNDPALAVRFLNLWSEVIVAEDRAAIEKAVKSFKFQTKLSDEVLGRYLRALAEIGVQDSALTQAWADLFKRAPVRGSLLIYAERFALGNALSGIQALPKEERVALGSRILALLEGLAQTKELDSEGGTYEKILDELKDQSNVEIKIGVLRCLRFKPVAKFEGWILTQAKDPNPRVELNAVIALKALRGSRDASELLAEKLESASPVIQGRALDALLFHTTLAGKRAVLNHLKTNLMNEDTVDKIYRSFDPEGKGGDEFVKDLNTVLKANPDHPGWEKLVSLRDRLATASPKAESGVEAATTSPELEALDERLIAAIPKFKELDPTTKLALRAAEQPFMQAVGLENLPIDKAPTVLEYCKALDLILEKHLGQKYLFPKLDRELHDFQTLWHRVGFGEEYPEVQKVLTLLGLKGKFTPESFPLHKARLMSSAFYNGKIVQDRFKIFDGLRAWAVIFLFFTRKIPLQAGAVGPLLKFPHSSDEKCIEIAKKLMQLQDLRNPAAHRQTYPELNSVKTVRDESVVLINTILEMIF